MCMYMIKYVESYLNSSKHINIDYDSIYIYIYTYMYIYMYNVC